MHCFLRTIILDQDEESLDQQQFHRDNKDFFRDYEELQDRKQELRYDRPSIKNYLEHCREKARQVIVAETEETLKAPCGFPNKLFSRAELYLYSLRHIQHHAAQLILRLRLDHNAEFPWVGSGWRND